MCSITCRDLPCVLHRNADLFTNFLLVLAPTNAWNLMISDLASTSSLKVGKYRCLQMAIICLYFLSTILSKLTWVMLFFSLILKILFFKYISVILSQFVTIYVEREVLRLVTQCVRMVPSQMESYVKKTPTLKCW